MPINNMNLFLSLAILGQNPDVEQGKLLAASVGAALIPGPLGLALPLIVANSESDGDITPEGATTLVEVPNVLDQEEERARQIIRDRKLNPVSKHVFIEIQTGGNAKKGLVVRQDPRPREFVPLGTDVTLTVSSGATPVTPPDSSVTEREILKDVQELHEAQIVTQNQLKQTVTQDQLKAVKDEILAALRETHSVGSVPGKG